MRAMSFRIKLLLAMMLVVAGATGTALYISQQQMQATYQRLFQQESLKEIENFSNLQEERRGAIKNRCLEVATNSVRVREVLHETDENDTTNLYLVARDEFRNLRDNTVLVFFDANGRFLRPPMAPRRFSRLGDGKTFINKVLAETPLQQDGMIAFESPDGRSQLHEIIVTKVLDQVAGEIEGAMLLAFPVPGMVSAGKNNPSPAPARTNAIGFGIWFDGQIYAPAKAIPENYRADLARQVSDHLGQAQTNFTIWPDTDPHLVFVEPLDPGVSLTRAYQVCLYSLADSYNEQQHEKSLILFFAALTLFGALLISLALTHGLSVPLRELVTGTNEIRRGNFDVKVRVRSRDDIGRLASSFNEMAEGLALKEKYRTVLNLVADEKVAKQLIDNQAALGGELREVSAIFCDVRGFTALTQNMPPEEVIDMLNEHMSVLARVVKQHNGVVDKFVGDALMAIFGAPVSHENDPFDAARCALSLVIEREKLNVTSKHKLRIGVGLATGKMVAGCMGSADRLNYTVLGERVNLAARLCSQAQAGQVVIDQTTRDRLGNAISATALPELQLKGFSESIVAYELQRAGEVQLNQ